MRIKDFSKVLFKVLFTPYFQLHFEIARIDYLILLFFHGEVDLALREGASRHVRVQSELAFRDNLHLVLIVDIHKLIMDKVVVRTVSVFKA